jgi:beclin 1
MLDCQRCRQPLLLDAWAHDGAPLRPALLGESYVVLPQARRPEALDLPRAPPAPAGRGPALQASSIHEQLRTVDRLVGLADRCASVPCGMPLCEECAAGVLRELDRRLHEARAEREMLQAAFAEIEAGDGEAVGEPPSEAEEAAERAAQAREVAELRASLAAARRERAALAAEAARLRAAQAASEAEEEHWHAEINGLGLTANREAEEALRTRQLAELCGRELRRLEAVDVCEDVFRIGAAGPFGTINGLRLGRMPGVAVDWAEINAGLGQVALLLVTVAREAGARFASHALLPMGSYSKVRGVGGNGWCVFRVGLGGAVGTSVQRAGVRLVG